MIIYRFLPAQFAATALQTGLLKVGRLSSLNDPSDCAPHLTDLPIQLEDFGGYAADSIFRNAAENIGIISYSTAIDDPVMWSHYGDGHGGIALGFNLEPTNTRRPISYKNEKIAVPYHSIEDEWDLGLVATGALHRKSPSWKYEQEVRDVVRLSDCKAMADGYFKVIDKKTLISVIRGERCSLSKNYIYNLLNSTNYSHGIHVKTAINRMDEFTINIQ